MCSVLYQMCHTLLLNPLTSLSLHVALPISLLDVSTHQQVPISGSDLLGSFTLAAHQTVSWDSFNGGVAAGGSITFRADRKSTRLNSSQRCISYVVFCFYI